LSEHVEAVVVEEEDAAGRIAVTVGERIDVNPLGAAMDRVQPRIIRLFGDFRRLDDAEDLRLSRIGLGVDDVKPRRPKDSCKDN
jgi:hypothetical protein